MVSRKLNFYFFAMAAHGDGISGGDRIFIELARRWSKEFPVKIFLWQEGFEMCKRQKLEDSKVEFEVVFINPFNNLGFFINYLSSIIKSIFLGLTVKVENSPSTVIYSASEFWMDSLPAFILKKRFPKIKWVASWYQTAPKPWIGFAQGERTQKYRLNALFYWLVQLPIKPLIEQNADFVFVNNDEEKKEFPKLNKKGRAIVVIGAVNLLDRDKYQKQFKTLPKIYDAVFQGRFHPQKGVTELIDIWEKVVGKNPQAKLGMIGDGPLIGEVRNKIKAKKLDKNIKLFGFLYDGEIKYKIFMQSRIVVHPAFFDSGGMASAEAMMFGLPCVGFDLPAYRSYYPKGMAKVKMGDLAGFANLIIKFLEDKRFNLKVAREAVKLIEDQWSWDKRARDLLDTIKKMSI